MAGREEQDFANRQNQSNLQKAGKLTAEVSAGINLESNLQQVNISLVEIQSQIDLFNVSDDTERLCTAYSIQAFLLTIKVSILEQYLSRK